LAAQVAVFVITRQYFKPTLQLLDDASGYYSII